MNSYITIRNLTEGLEYITINTTNRNLDFPIVGEVFKLSYLSEDIYVYLAYETTEMVIDDTATISLERILYVETISIDKYNALLKHQETNAKHSSGFDIYG